MALLLLLPPTAAEERRNSWAFATATQLLNTTVKALAIPINQSHGVQSFYNGAIMTVILEYINNYGLKPAAHTQGFCHVSKERLQYKEHISVQLCSSMNTARVVVAILRSPGHFCMRQP
ncbi:hypothetical protein Anapl_15476 [Anas platyrhynchos]|uniref:Uncharacterized protein n=1 Tax=Anas platyrhynchos TaxID=8839 RepID=R0K0F4_ANAPL|nr:hypothetical protein Anapl_15476 [Anas platyrhynchos]